MVRQDTRAAGLGGTKSLIYGSQESKPQKSCSLKFPQGDIASDLTYSH